MACPRHPQAARAVPHLPTIPTTHRTHTPKRAPTGMNGGGHSSSHIYTHGARAGAPLRGTLVHCSRRSHPKPMTAVGRCMALAPLNRPHALTARLTRPSRAARAQVTWYTRGQAGARIMMPALSNKRAPSTHLVPMPGLLQSCAWLLSVRFRQSSGPWPQQASHHTFQHNGFPPPSCIPSLRNGCIQNKLETSLIHSAP